MLKKKINPVILLALPVAILLLFGFRFGPFSSYEHSMNSYIINDSTNSQNGGMMGRGMMNGRMMGRGMMNSGNNNGNSAPNKYDKNGKWVAPASANSLKNPLEKIAEASQKGKNIFNMQCFTCHGTDGKGDGPAAVSLHPKPANLTSSRVQHESDGAIFWKITNGNSPMPSFKSALTKTQRWDLVEYIRELGK